ncbi:MAG: response regulator [Bacteroidetes bacterium]|jgi:signal transduction histidine kinase/CheY-like chemotaxis protein|nr:response regulator [Bacteroidota bacterium]
MFWFSSEKAFFESVYNIFNIIQNHYCNGYTGFFVKPLLFFFALFIQQAALPAGQEYIVQNYTVEDGLPVNSVNRMAQDTDGYLYFATTDGLAQFDGYEFVVYNSGNTSGLASNRISEMNYIPEEDELWLLHADGALTLKIGSTFQNFSVEKNGIRIPAHQMHIHQNGDLWVITSVGVARFNRNTQQFQLQQQDLLQSAARAMAWTSSQQLVLVNENGLVQRQNGNTSLLLAANEFPIPYQSISSVKEINGNLWVTGNGGAFRYSLNENQINFRFSLSDDPGHVWGAHPLSDSVVLLNSSRGFYRFNSKTGTVQLYHTPFYASTERANLVYKGNTGEDILIGFQHIKIDGKTVLTTDDIISGFLDRSGSLWISTLYDGVYQIRRSVLSNITSEEIPEFENIYPVIQSLDGSIWAGSFHNGIYQLSDGDYQNWNSQNSSLPAQNSRFLFEDRSGTLYAGITSHGLWVFRNNNWRKLDGLESVTGPEITVEAMHEYNNGYLLGTSDRMVSYQNAEFSLFNDFESASENPFQHVRVVRENRRGTLFTGSFGYGLTILKDGVARNYRAENSSLQSNFIRDIYVQSEDTIWVATEDLGLNRILLNSDGVPVEFTSLMEQDGLIHNSLHRIIEDVEGRLWISSNGGIMAISLRDLNNYADGDLESLPVIGFNENDGMVNREANGGVQTAGFISDDRQQIFFPNQRGLTVIHLSRLKGAGSEHRIKPVIENIAFADSMIYVDQNLEIELPISERNIRIEFTAPNVTSPQRTTFRYRLDDVNREWEISNDLRQAVFTNIPPGWHTFHLEVFQPQAQQIPEATSIDIFVPYYFYETKWFYGIMILLSLLLMLGGIKYRTRRLEQRERTLKQRVNEQTQELKEAADQKTKFFSGITHELKTPLSLIASPLDDLLEGNMKLSEKKAKERLHLMKRNSDRLQNLVDQILGVSKLNANKLALTFEPVHIVEITEQLIGQFHSKLEQNEISLMFESDNIDEKIYLNTDAWERILINLMSNAIRFSPRKSTIQVKLSNLGKSVGLSVKDQGIGIDKSDTEKVFEYLYQAEGSYSAEGTGIGLYLVKGLVEHMNGNIEIISEKGEGAEFVVTLQKGYSHFRESDSIIHFPASHPLVQKRKETDKSLSPDQNGSPSKKEHLLLVEDNDDFRNYLQSVLSEEYQVSIAREGTEALELLQDETVDLVISDVMMPKMNGLEFVNILRKQEDYQKLPVIFLSAKNLDTDKEAGLSSGADIYLTKPIKSKLLLSQIDAVLRRENVLKKNQLHEEDIEEDQLVKDIRELVYRQLANPSLSVDLLADAMFVSRSKLYADWKEVCDTSLNAFIKKTRLDEGKKLIKEQDFSVQEAATAVGFPDPNYFSTSFKKEYGVSPSEV